MQPDTHTIYELSPLFPIGDWWQVLLWAVFAGLLVLWIVWLYFKDTAKLDRSLAYSLTAMRLLVVAALVVFAIGVEKRTESNLVKTSRVAVLVDTSLSMGLSDELESDLRPTRSAEVVDWIKTQQPIQRLSKQHDVTVYRFDDANRPEVIVSIPKQESVIEKSEFIIDRNPNRRT